MHYIVGLGNPGKEYDNTRHNVGFAVLQDFTERAHFSSWFVSQKKGGSISEGVIDGKEVAVLLPDTFMNESGKSVHKFVQSGQSAQLVVVHDDIDIPLGELKVSFGRGDGGHNGIKSIIASLGTKDFVRVRVGIGKKGLFTGKLKRPQGNALSSYVLGRFTKGEEKELSHVKDTLHDLLLLFITQGKEKVMNSFN